MGSLFGTDGVRGVANADLSPELAYRLGRATAYVLARHRQRPPILVGRDTRISGDLLEAALAAGILSTGADVWRVGVVPTPAVAYLTRELGAAAGVVISASHNPVADNGIKLFGPDGYKLPDALEEEIEGLASGAMTEIPYPVGAAVGRILPCEESITRYLEHARRTIRVPLSGLRIVVDCANGSASRSTPQVLRELGAEVLPLNCEPDGLNINLDCGSLCPGGLQQAVLAHGAHLGLAHDGDADRLIAVDEKGCLVDGDRIILACALYLKARGELAGNTVVVTVMSNGGLHRALREAGIEVRETPVGDRYVLEEMRRCGANLGGEQSGHIIFLQHNTTGDGLITALQLLEVMVVTGAPLSALAARMESLPQVTRNVHVRDKEGIVAHPRLREAIALAGRQLDGRGRILVRPSGTEPVIRIMVEGPVPGELEAIVAHLEEVVRQVAS
ncbi:MAG: phosphoglucosamine mutase [Clostridia bacterium]|nr:phosphoglucosamine mutase [Clostridia bacterium]